MILWRQTRMCWQISLMVVARIVLDLRSRVPLDSGSLLDRLVRKTFRKLLQDGALGRRGVRYGVYVDVFCCVCDGGMTLALH